MSERRRLTSRRELGLLAGAVGAALVVCVAALGAGRSGHLDADAADAASPSTPSATARDVRWLGVLDRLDAVRAQAWRTGNPALLKQVYVAGSDPLRADRRMIDAFQARGWRPDDVRLELLAAEIVDRRPGEVTLAELDRLLPVRVHTDVGGVATLPVDQPTAHTIVLRRVGGRWLIADVVDRRSAD